jgi:hypothetical protein
MFNTSEKYYKSIDEMPLNNWIECNNGSINYCRLNLKKGNDKDDLVYWELIQDQYLKDFGLNDSFKELTDTQKLKALAELEYIETGKRIILNKVRLYDEKLKNMLTNKGENVDIDVVLVYLSKYLGYKIDKFTIKVREYFTMLNIYIKENATTN